MDADEVLKFILLLKLFALIAVDAILASSNLQLIFLSGELENLLGTNLNKVIFLSLTQTQLNFFINRDNGLNLKRANLLRAPLDMLFTFALLGKANDIYGLVLTKFENYNRSGLFDPTPNNRVLYGND